MELQELRKQGELFVTGRKKYPRTSTESFLATHSAGFFHELRQTDSLGSQEGTETALKWDFFT